MKVNPIFVIILITIINRTTASPSIVKRQIVFPNDDYEDSSENTGIQERYARPHYNYPAGNRYHFGFNRHFNKRPQNYYNQQQTFYPTQNIPQFKNQNQIPVQNFRPSQNLQFGGSQQSNNFQPPQNLVSSTPSPQVQACVDSCLLRTPGQFNPVCGTDNLTYQNQERFTCANECGLNIQMLQRGRCPRPTLPPWQNK